MAPRRITQLPRCNVHPALLAFVAISVALSSAVQGLPGTALDTSGAELHVRKQLLAVTSSSSPFSQHKARAQTKARRGSTAPAVKARRVIDPLPGSSTTTAAGAGLGQTTNKTPALQHADSYVIIDHKATPLLLLSTNTNSTNNSSHNNASSAGGERNFVVVASAVQIASINTSRVTQGGSTVGITTPTKSSSGAPTTVNNANNSSSNLLSNKETQLMQLALQEQQQTGTHSVAPDKPKSRTSKGSSTSNMAQGSKAAPKTDVNSHQRLGQPHVARDHSSSTASTQQPLQRHSQGLVHPGKQQQHQQPQQQQQQLQQNMVNASDVAQQGTNQTSDYDYEEEVSDGIPQPMQQKADEQQQTHQYTQQHQRQRQQQQQQQQQQRRQSQPRPSKSKQQQLPPGFTVLITQQQQHHKPATDTQAADDADYAEDYAAEEYVTQTAEAPHQTPGSPENGDGVPGGGATGNMPSINGHVVTVAAAKPTGPRRLGLSHSLGSTRSQDQSNQAKAKTKTADVNVLMRDLSLKAAKVGAGGKTAGSVSSRSKLGGRLPANTILKTAIATGRTQTAATAAVKTSSTPDLITCYGIMCYSSKQP